MGLISTISGFCYVECDGQGCNKKIEHIDEKRLRELAGMCGWENRDDQWACPNCVKIPARGKGKTSRSRGRKKVASKR